MVTIDDMLSQVAKIVNSAPGVSSAKTVTEKKIEKTAELEVKKTVKPADMQRLPLSLAKEIVYCIERGAEKFGINAVISIVNDAGRLIAFEAMDNSYLASIKASQDKAYTAAALQMPTHEALKESRGGAFDGLTNGDGILLLGGGYPLCTGGKMIGAVGVSGGTKDEDIMLAKMGVLYLERKLAQ